MTHVSFVSFQVKALTTGFSDDLTDIQIIVQLLLNTRDLRTAVSCSFQFVGNVGVGTNQRSSSLVKSSTLRFMFLEVSWDFRIPAEVVNMFQLTFWRLNWFA